MPIRWLSRIENREGSLSLILPTHRYEYEQQQALVSSMSPLMGSDYSFDQLGTGRSIKANATERVRFLDVDDTDQIDTDVDRFKSVFTWGSLKLWTTGSNGERWAWARMVEQPQISLTVENTAYLPIIMSFERFSDWHGPDSEVDVTLDSDPQTIEVVNEGNAQVYDSVIIVKGAFSGLIIENQSAIVPGTTLTYLLQTSSSGISSDDWIKFDSSRGTIEISNDAGVSWNSDSANFERQEGQIRLMIFESGANELVVSGASGCDVVVQLVPAWH